MRLPRHPLVPVLIGLLLVPMSLAHAADLVLDFESPADVRVLDQSFKPAGSARPSPLDPVRGRQCLEVRVDGGRKGAQVIVGGRSDLSGARYVDFWLKAAIGTEIRFEFFRPGAQRANWRPNYGIEVLTEGWRRYHYAIDDFASWTRERTPADLTPPTAFRMLVMPPPPGLFGVTAEAARTIYLDDFRITHDSDLLARQSADSPVAVRVDASRSQGVMTRPWEGIVYYTVNPDILLGELGMRYSRMGGLNINTPEFNSRIFQGVGRYDFSPLDAVNERLKSRGAYSFNWIPAIPQFLWRERNRAKGNPAAEIHRPLGAFQPPTDYAAWRRVVADWVHHQSAKGFNVAGYSIGNEVDSKAFWAGTPDEYDEFYAQTAAAVKQGDPHANVIGPSHSRFSVRLLRDFLDACARRKAPLDYLSWHHYMNGEAAEMLTDEATVARRLLAQYPEYRDARLTNNEWGYSLAPQFTERSRGPLGAAAIAAGLGAMVEGGYDMALFFMASAQQKPVFWGSGLYDFDGRTARPLIYTFSLFNKLGRQRLESKVEARQGGIGSLASTDADGVVRVLTWWYVTGTGSESGVRRIDLEVSGARAGAYRVERSMIDREHGQFVMGRGYERLQPVMTGSANGPHIALSFDLPLYGVALVTLTPQR